MSWLGWGSRDRFERETRRLERPGAPDEVEVRSFTNNLGERRFIVEGRRLGVHLGDKVFRSHPDALVYAKMIASWEGARLVDKGARDAK